jgi:hypothetical protein
MSEYATSKRVTEELKNLLESTHIKTDDEIVKYKKEEQEIPKEEVLRVQEVAFVDVASFPSLPTATNKVPLCVRSLILLDPKGEVC